jgi:branched-subunit amino acid ABC-type transport system permease component
MALEAGTAGWAALRFAAGAASAFVLVYTSGMIFEVAARNARPMLGSLVYSGVGVGIALTALVVYAGRSAGLDAPSLWLAMGAIAAALALAPWRSLTLATPGRPGGDGSGAAAPPPGAAAALRRLIVAYACLGFGYVITATFIVVMVRRLPNAPVWEFWAWMTVGLAGAPSNWLWARLAARVGPYRAIVAAFVHFAIGVALAALAGMIAAPVSSVYPNMGGQVLIICFVVVVIGGIGSSTLLTLLVLPGLYRLGWRAGRPA